MRVVAFTRYGPRAASTRQRFLQYLPFLREAGLEVEHYPLLDDQYVASLVTGHDYSATKVARAYFDRFQHLIRGRSADLYWIYVELFPYVPALVERLATAGTPVVYDFDDAFFHSYDQSANPLVRGMLGKKHAALLGAAAACCCGNAYLHEYAGRHCQNSIILPTVVDTALYRPQRRQLPDPVTIGWIGSPSTWPNVQPMLPLLEELVRSQGVRFRVVGAGKSAEKDQFPGMELIEWTEATEIAEVQAMDIGIMPLSDRPFERGKSGYKLVQYMACGLPVVASPVGVNCEIVVHGDNGFLVSSQEEWREALCRLISNQELRHRLGESGRRRATESYSLASQYSRLISVMKNALGTTKSGICAP